MQPFKPCFVKSAARQLAGLAFTFLLSACAPPAPGIWKDGQISSSKRSDFHQLNTEALNYLKIDKLKELQLMMSKEMVDNPGNEHLADLISNRLADNPYVVLEEYYVVNKRKDKDSLSATGTDINRHTVKYKVWAPEMYFAFLAPKQSDNKYLISLEFSKLNYGWRLTEMDLEEYTANGKTAPELFKLAQDEYYKKYLVNAVNNMTLVSGCIRPSTLWQYPDAQKMTDFNDKVLGEANKKLRYPIDITGLPTRPRILRVYTQTNDNWTSPMIYYMTHIDIKDTTEVKKENMQIRKVIGKLLPGLDKDNKYIYYDAFNEFPTAERSVDRFEMIDKLP